jgi:hypothetical protein
VILSSTCYSLSIQLFSPYSYTYLRISIIPYEVLYFSYHKALYIDFIKEFVLFIDDYELHVNGLMKMIADIELNDDYEVSLLLS